MDTWWTLGCPWRGWGSHPADLTHHQVADDHDHEEDGEAHGLAGHLHAVPHGLDPFPAQDAEDDEEGVEEVVHVPAGQVAVCGDLAHALLVALAEQLHAHHGEDEHDDGQHQRQVAQCPHRVADDLDEHVQRWPRLGQLEDPQLPGRARAGAGEAQGPLAQPQESPILIGERVVP